MKKIISILLMAVLVATALLPVSVSAETYVPARTINLVYDDSGSMIRTGGGQYVDTWCQAKYAMEVFAAMLGEKDTLNIYYMSDYVSGTSAPPKIVLKGSKVASTTESNVKTIHNTITDASDTPFNSVKKAYSDLKEETNCEKWLVVLTDGEFNGTSNSTVQNYFQDCVADGETRVIMFSMGPEAAVITPDTASGIFFYKAENNTDIPAMLTSVCNRIFQNNALPYDATNKTSSFNIPMSELIVFAQGKDVKIGSITDANGNKYTANSNVKVMYSSEATTDKGYPLSETKVADNLSGYVATFSCDFEPGTYTFDVTGADTTEIYYKPNVTIAAYLYDNDGNEVTQEAQLIAGTYRLEFGFLNAVTGEKVTDTSLLGNISYAATITNTVSGGEPTTVDAVSGDSVTIRQGHLDIDVTANFLEYNTVNTKLSYEIFAFSNLIFKFTEKPTYSLSTSGISDDTKPMVLTVQIETDGEVRDLTAQEWELLGIPSITTKADVGEFRIEQTETIGTYHVYPTLKDGDPLETHGGTIDMLVEGSFVEGSSSAEGSLEDSFELTDGISSMDRLKDWLAKNGLKLAIGLGIFFIFLGYVPPFKKYLPRKLKKRPYIDCRAEKIGVRDREAHGVYKRNLASTLIPYKAETGSVTFSPSPYRKVAMLKATKSKGINVTNVKAFAGKDNITFNGMSIEENRVKPYRINANSTISLKSPEYNYTCYLNR